MQKQYILFRTLAAFIGIGIISLSITSACKSSKLPEEVKNDTIYTNVQANGYNLEVKFYKGKYHNHPLMALWLSDTNFMYIETLYVAQSIAKGTYGHGDKSTGKWLPGPIRRPAALPVWSHNRNIRESDGLFIPMPETAMPDAITGPTPPADFIVRTKTTNKVPETFDVWFEINQTWDWNEYWTNNKFPNDKEYKTSCQPSLVYKARLNSNNHEPLLFELVGHGHPSGKDDEINTNTSTITTALEITELLKVRLLPSKVNH